MSEYQATTKLKLSVLDGVGLYNGETAGEALAHSVNAAKLVERLGYTRLWFTEHHNSKHQMSTAPDILIAHMAALTTTIRVGSGGIMLPNHSPLRIVENFSILEVLHPGRIDLGMGRASGTDGITNAALR
ncbi:MAG: MsnO8 family LLM class oxidoreductase, partial [Gaiellales bacterium]